MEESDTEKGGVTPQNDRRTDSPISVLYVDGDPDAWNSLSTYVADSDDVAIERVRDPSVARSMVGQHGIDVAVVEATVPDSADDPLLETAIPTVLYTASDPQSIDDPLLGAADSLVEKGVADSERYLVEKIEGMVTGTSQREEFSADALARLSVDIGETAGIFVLDDTGMVIWESQRLESLFETNTEDDSPVAQADFYAHLAAVLRDQPETLSTLLGLRHNERVDQSQLVEIDGSVGSNTFFHASYPVEGSLGAERVVVFIPLTTVVEEYERLELFEELVDNAEDGLYVLDADGRIEYCNRSYAEMVGYDPEELMGEHASVLMAEGEIESGQTAVSDALASDDDSGVVDMTLTHRDGSTVHTSIHGSVRHDSSGAYAGVMGVVRDITERKRRERELEEYRNLVENAVDPMYVLDRNGAIQVVNEALTEFVGQSRSQLVGTDVRDILPLESIDAGRDVLSRIVSNDEIENESFEMWMTSADGDERLFEVTLSAVTEAGEFVGSVATYRDITERHRQQEQLDLRKQIFARSLRHNIRNETSVIHSYGSILADELDGEHAEMATAILEASQSLAGTSRKVSQFDWLVEKESETVEHDLFALVKRSIEQVRATNEDADIGVDIPESLRVCAVRDLDVAIKNLVENALQHGDDDGPPTVTVSATARAETVSLVVADDGPGIPAQEVDVIEQGRETALDHASGLGLWLVKRVVTQSDGRLTFETDDGTRAEITLARADERE